MRLLYMIDSLSIGGAERLLVDIVSAARNLGDECEVAYFTPGPLADDLRRLAVPATRLSTSGLRDPRALLRAVSLMRRFRPDVVHTHLTKSDVIGQIAARIAGVKTRVLTHHNTDPWRRNRMLSTVYCLATCGATARTGVSSEVARYVEDTGGSPEGSVQVIRNGIDLAVFDPDRVVPLDLSRYGVAKTDTVFAIVGRLVPQKDHNNFLKAAELALGRAPALRFLVVGDGPLRARLEETARRIGGDRIVFTGVILDAPALFAAVDGIVFSSAWEGLPVALVEAMAMGLPVASTDVGAIGSVLVDRESGLLVPSGDPGALADAMVRLASDPAMRTRMGRRGRDIAVKGFSNTSMLSRLQGIYSAASLVSYPSNVISG